MWALGRSRGGQGRLPMQVWPFEFGAKLPCKFFRTKILKKHLGLSRSHVVLLDYIHVECLVIRSCVPDPAEGELTEPRCRRRLSACGQVCSSALGSVCWWLTLVTRKRHVKRTQTRIIVGRMLAWNVQCAGRAWVPSISRSPARYHNCL